MTAGGAAPIHALVTGADGFLGWHVRCRCIGEPDVILMPVGRSAFDDLSTLRDLVHRANWVVHLAGQNRGLDSVLTATNRELAVTISEMISTAPHPISVVYASSIHIERDTPYGRSKLEVGDILTTAAESTGGSCSILVFPHIFGERGRPFYNSVVATFCHQIANGEEPVVVENGNLELLHAQRAADAILNCMRGTQVNFRPAGHKIDVVTLHGRLRRLAAMYQSNVLPDVRDPLELELFNTYRHYLFPRQYPKALKIVSDNRGQLFEAVKSLNGGQSFLSSTRPGITRGNHFHRRKFERFLVLSGQARIQMRRLFDREVHSFEVNGDKPCVVDMPTMHTHNITNTNDRDLVTMFWSSEVFDPKDPDTYAEAV
jgi:UDP-2-acetamido-2,6-beta-L-arabino-hexul-4-ose reductase